MCLKSEKKVYICKQKILITYIINQQNLISMKKIIFFSMLALFIFTTTSCEQEIEQEEFEARNLSDTGCKKDTKKSSQKSVKEYIHFKTINNKYLDVLHVNSEFNCCPGELLVNTALKNDTILINEDEAEHGCKCLCYYDFKYQLGPLNYGKYHIVLQKFNKPVAKFDLEFNENTNVIINIEVKN